MTGGGGKSSARIASILASKPVEVSLFSFCSSTPACALTDTESGSVVETGLIPVLVLASRPDPECLCFGLFGSVLKALGNRAGPRTPKFESQLDQ